MRNASLARSNPYRHDWPFANVSVVTSPMRKVVHDLHDVAEEFEAAVVKFFNKPRGFGYVTLTRTGEDVHLAQSILERFGLVPRQGQLVWVKFGPGRRGCDRTVTHIRHRSC